MPEVRNVQAQSVDERCPSCGQGWMRGTGVVLTTNPPQYPHKCTICTHTQTYGVNYPYIVHQ